MDSNKDNPTPPQPERRIRHRDEQQQQRWEFHLRNEEEMLLWLEQHPDQREEYKRRQAEAKMMLENMAAMSPKTDLPNERVFKNVLNAELNLMSLITGYTGYIGYMDVDNLRLANAQGGHAGGDQLLNAVAAALNEVTDEYTEQLTEAGQMVRIYPAHLSGDEFGILLAGFTKEQATEAGQKILSKIAERKAESDLLRQLPTDSTASIGFLRVDRDSGDENSVLKEADLTMFVGKSKGKNQVVFREDLTDEDLAKAAEAKK